MALSNLYLLKFNNYFNRYIKRLGSVSAYIAQASFTLPNTSFNPADGINTQHVVNTAIAADYVVVTDQSDSAIESRWFVIENSRNRAGQYTLTLHRDVIADYYDEIISSPCYIEKATLQPNDPFIFNPEGNGFNQIKTKETLLKDHYGIPWIVGYYNLTNDTPTVTGKATVDTSDAWKTYATQEEFLSDYPEGNYDSHIEKCEIISYITPTGSGEGWKATITTDGNLLLTDSVEQNVTNIVYRLFGNDSPDSVDLRSVYERSAATVWNQTDAAVYDIKGGNDYSSLQTADRKKIKIGEKFYRMRVYTRHNQRRKVDIPVNSGAFLALKAAWLQISGYQWDDTQTNPFETYATFSIAYYQLKEIAGNNVTIELNATRNSLKDQPWKMFAIPYGSYYIGSSDGKQFLRVDGAELALNLATDLAKTTSVVYDVQILPYTINNGFWDFDEEWHEGLPVFKEKLKHNGTAITNKYEIEYFYGDGIDPFNLPIGYTGPYGFIWFPETCSFRSDITLSDPIIITEPKVQNECDMYRVVGPNYAGAFQFNPAKNGGCSRFEINCTYLPASPYIHVNPTFGGLYGSDFDDVRGLVCQGNFSISTVSDAWKNYVIQNKNYNEIFNREVENMEINREVEKTREAWNVGTGVLSGAVSGAVGGASVGGVIGGIVGGIVGAGASLAGGLTDMEITQKLYDESKSYKQDMRNYSLGNIKALPYTLSKTTGYNVDNKYFPFLEYYTCTEKEKKAFRDQLKYTGMTVMRTGTIGEFLTDDYSYIQGKMILINGIDDDFHLLKAISEEIGKGVYIK